MEEFRTLALRQLSTQEAYQKLRDQIKLMSNWDIFDRVPYKPVYKSKTAWSYRSRVQPNEMTFFRPKAAVYKGAELLLMSIAVEEKFEGLDKNGIENAIAQESIG